MSLPQTFSAALLASKSLLLAAPALRVVPGSSHYSDRREETERHLSANGTAFAGKAADMWRPAPGTAAVTTFDDPMDARTGEAASIGSRHDRTRTGAPKPRQIRGR